MIYSIVALKLPYYQKSIPFIIKSHNCIDRLNIESKFFNPSLLSSQYESKSFVITNCFFILGQTKHMGLTEKTQFSYISKLE